MRKILLSVATTIALALLCQPWWASDCAVGQDKKQPQKVQDIDALVKDLESTSALTRENATKCLLATPGALHSLRRKLAGKDFETRRRMEFVIREQSKVEFRRRIESLAKEGPHAPIDLLGELIIENREDVDDPTWKRILEITTQATNLSAKANQLTLTIPDPPEDFLKLPFSRGEKITVARVDGLRIVSDELVIQRGELDRCALITGQVGKLSFSNSSIAIILGGRNKGPKTLEINTIASSFFYSDVDVRSTIIDHSIVTSRGTVESKRNLKAAVFDSRSPAPPFGLFSVEQIGLRLKVVKQERTTVSEVIPKSIAARSGILAGDILVLEKTTTLQDFVFEVRRALAKQADLTVHAMRNGKQLSITMAMFN